MPQSDDTTFALRWQGRKEDSVARSKARSTKPQHQPRGTGPLAALRVKRGLSQRDVATVLGVTSALIGILEAGGRGTRLDKIYSLARVYGVEAQVVLAAFRKCRTRYARRNGRKAANGGPR